MERDSTVQAETEEWVVLCGSGTGSMKKTESQTACSSGVEDCPLLIFHLAPCDNPCCQVKNSHPFPRSNPWIRSCHGDNVHTADLTVWNSDWIHMAQDMVQQRCCIWRINNLLGITWPTEGLQASQENCSPWSKVILIYPVVMGLLQVAHTIGPSGRIVWAC